MSTHGGGQDDALQIDPPPHFIGSVILHIHVCMYLSSAHQSNINLSCATQTQKV